MPLERGGWCLERGKIPNHGEVIIGTGCQCLAVPSPGQPTYLALMLDQINEGVLGT
jgi:hypothetical protein